MSVSAPWQPLLSPQDGVGEHEKTATEAAAAKSIASDSNDEGGAGGSRANGASDDASAGDGTAAKCTGAGADGQKEALGKEEEAKKEGRALGQRRDTPALPPLSSVASDSHGDTNLLIVAEPQDSSSSRSVKGRMASDNVYLCPYCQNGPALCGVLGRHPCVSLGAAGGQPRSRAPSTAATVPPLRRQAAQGNLCRRSLRNLPSRRSQAAATPPTQAPLPPPPAPSTSGGPRKRQSGRQRLSLASLRPLRLRPGGVPGAKALRRQWLSPLLQR